MITANVILELGFIYKAKRANGAGERVLHFEIQGVCNKLSSFIAFF